MARELLGSKRAVSPVVASLLMIAKERSWRTAGAMVVLIMPLAFIIGGLLYRFLFTIGWGI